MPSLLRHTGLPIALVTLAALLLAGCSVIGVSITPAPPPTPIPWDQPQVTVFQEGFLGPIGMAKLPDGSLLVAEEGTGGRDDSGGVSLIKPDGRAGRLISGFPSTRDAGDLAGVPLVSLSPDGSRIYVGNFGAGHLWVLPLTPEQQEQGLAIPDTPVTPADLDVAMEPWNLVMLVNPFDMTYDPEGVPVVSDASENGVAKETPDGRTVFIHRFADLPNPDKPWDTIEAVPTGITRVDRPDGQVEYLVTLTGGCPYPEGGGRLVAIDEERNQRTVVDGLNMPIDVIQSPGGLLILEFARFTPGSNCFDGSGYRPKTGRLSRLLPDGTLEPILTDLDFPGALLWDWETNSLFISQVFHGRILRVTFGGAASDAQSPGDRSEDPSLAQPASQVIDQQLPSRLGDDLDIDLDAALKEVAARLGLRPFPGQEEREPPSPLTELGRNLFFDPILSGDQNISCATCHHPDFAMADGRVLPIGSGGEGLGPHRRFAERLGLGPEASPVRRLTAEVDAEGKAWVGNPFLGRFVPRNSQTVLNAALSPAQFWDGRVEQREPGGPVHTLEAEVNRLGLTDPLATQALFPIVSTLEMAGATFGELAPQTIRRALLARLRAIPEYREAFARAFGDTDGDPITLEGLAAAIAAFERTLIFTDAPWDRYLAGDADALTPQQKRGALLFFGAGKPGVNCAACHSGDLFTDNGYHNILAPQLGPGKGHGYTGREDWGRAGVTFQWSDRYRFRTPSLRNVALTAPYFHDGAFATLEDAVRHHANIWESAAGYDPSQHGIPPSLYSSLRPFEPEKQGDTVDPLLAQGQVLDDQDVADLVAFLQALTDPAAQDLAHLIPQELPSGLPVEKSTGPGNLADSTEANPQPSSPPAAQSPSPPIVQSPIPAPRSSISGDIRFTNVAQELGLTFRHGAFAQDVYPDPVAAMGGGLCWLDFDRDGWLDLYLVNSHAEDEAAYWMGQGGLPRNGLFRNVGGRFVDVSQGSGADLALRGNGCLAADFDNDGWTDLFVTADGPNALLWNNGDGTFREGAAAAGLAAPEWNSAAVAGDLNGDGWLDLFVAAYIDLDRRVPKPVGAFPQDYYGLPDRLYLNQGPGPDGRVTFREVTQEAGLEREERGLGALLSDFDQDGDLDLYIANDGHPNRLHLNEPWPGGPAADPAGLGFRFVEITEQAEVGDAGSGMGVAGGDYNGDGWTDLLITNWERELNALYRNQMPEEGQLAFQYATFRIGVSGLGDGVTGWGVHMGDFDQDTDTDILIVNGRVPVTNLETDPERVRYFRNRTVNLNGAPQQPNRFFDWTEQVGLAEVGPLLGRGAGVADFDNDGDLDVAINQVAGPAVLLRNDGEPGHWLQVAPQPPLPGTVVTVALPDGRILRRELYAGSSYISTEAPRLHFGLGVYDRVSRVTVRWPDGHTVTWTDVSGDRILASQR